MKKTLSIILALMMLVCSGSIALAEAPAFKNTDTYPLQGDHTITMTTSFLEEKDEYPILEAFGEATGVKIDVKVVDKEQTPLLYAGSKKEVPELYFTTSGKAGVSLDQIREYGMAGYIINYADYLDQMPNLKAAIERDSNVLNYVVNEDGSFYTLPHICSTLTQAGPAYYIREDHMKLVGWEKAPATIEEFEQFLRDLQAYFGPNDPLYIPFTVANTGVIAFSGKLTEAFFSFFGDLLEPSLTTTLDGKNIAVGFATEQYKRFVTYFHKLYADKLLDNECFTTDANYIKTFLADGHTSVNYNMSSMLPAHFPSGNLDIIMPAPLTSEWQSEKRYFIPDKYSWWCSLVGAESENLDAILAFLDSLYTTEDNPIDEEGTLWGACFWLGKYGRDWEWREEDKSSYNLLIPEGYTNRNDYLDGTYFLNGPYVSDLISVEYNEYGSYKPKAVEVQKNLYPYGVKTTRTAWLQLTEDENDIYVDAWADIKAYVTEMHAAFITGEADIEAEWDNYLAELDAMGLQDVIDVYQAALDRFNK